MFRNIIGFIVWIKLSVKPVVYSEGLVNNLDWNSMEAVV